MAGGLQTLRVDADWQRQWGDTDVCMGIWGRDRVSNMKREPVPHWRSLSIAGVGALACRAEDGLESACVIEICCFLVLIQ